MKDIPENNFEFELFENKNWFQKLFYRFNLAFSCLLGKGIIVIRIDNVVKTNQIDDSKFFSDYEDKSVYEYDMSFKSTGINEKTTLSCLAESMKQIMEHAQAKREINKFLDEINKSF